MCIAIYYIHICPAAALLALEDFCTKGRLKVSTMHIFIYIYLYIYLSITVYNYLYMCMYLCIYMYVNI